MRILPAVRKSVKWGGAALVVGLATAWIGSAWWYVVSPTFGAHQFGLGLGRLSWLTEPSAASVFGSWYWRECSNFPFFWWFQYTTGPKRCGLYIPLWPALLITLIATGFAWRADLIAHRLAMISSCMKCGYSRTGLAAGAVCPECGAAPLAAVKAAKADLAAGSLPVRP